MPGRIAPGRHRSPVGTAADLTTLAPPISATRPAESRSSSRTGYPGRRDDDLPPPESSSKGRCSPVAARACTAAGRGFDCMHAQFLFRSLLLPFRGAQASWREQFLLQLIEHLGQGALDLQGLLDLVGGDIRILPVFDEARTLVVADELDERFRVRFPVRRKPLEVLENRVDAGLSEESDRILGVFVEIGVEDPLVHEP